MLTIKELSARHLAWAKDKTQLTQLDNDTIKVESPFVDSFNDGLAIYVVPADKDNQIMLTDDGWTNDNLESHGLFLSRSPRRLQDLVQQLRVYGVTFSDYELTITGSQNDFGRLKDRLLQAMIFANDMFTLAPTDTSRYFHEDVEQYFSANSIRTIKNVSYVGASGLTHKFDFAIPGNNRVPMKLIKLLGNPNNPIFAQSIFTDIYETQQQQTEATNYFVFLNNEKIQSRGLNPDILALFNQVSATPVPFTERQRFLSTFSE
ncbi:DUF1828 domain-containing protein [Schleiferilactobacillus shenzhenensis]|uniref:DUF1828 domain-containing protein n=1 Tax=Schleiferilactobacillus shenzhenensis LY-73 TaxID=1231336 RepID=U4TIV7_9LACO|nr:DUF1828 domain-containing protein [Schleiferilactobacillus shenzhenensis]ERL64751.1 hypothetical protein L248_0670 [Schleiferilactobacillus shenzhenensis LY-73]